MDQDKVVGPVQLSLATFAGPELPERIRRLVDDLRHQRLQGLRLVDALVLKKHVDGTIIQDADVDPEAEIRSTGLIPRLLDYSAAQGALDGARPTAPDLSSARGVLFLGEPMPDPRDRVPSGSKALVLLIEHRWAAPLREAVLHAEVAPAGSAWVGTEALQELELVPPDVAALLASA